MPRWVVFLVVGVIAAFFFIGHECVATERTGGQIDLTEIEGPYGEPIPGPGVLPEATCTTYDEKIGLRALVGLAIALGVSLLGWSGSPGSANRETRVPWSTYVTSELGSGKTA